MNAQYKMGLLLDLIAKHPGCFVIADMRTPGVKVPDIIRPRSDADPFLFSLTVGYRTVPPIPDLCIHAIEGVSGTFTFSLNSELVSHHVNVPWAAIKGLADPNQQGAVFDEVAEHLAQHGPTDTYLPDNMVTDEKLADRYGVTVQRNADGAATLITEPPKRTRPAWLTVHDGGGEGSDSEQPDLKPVETPPET